MTLTEFLTARLDEDEAVALTSRAWREVEAKRAIVAEREAIAERQRKSSANFGAWVAGEHEPHPGVTSTDDCDVARRDALDVALCALASVYSDHEAFREEWAQ